MSNRVVAIKILGVGHAGYTQPATFTTRAHPLYSSSLAGTVTSLANQLSSEIAVFGNLGSDSTTSFTVLSTAATREILLSRGKVPVLGYQNQPARMQGYVPPDPGYVQLIASAAPGAFVDGNYYRVQNTAFRCFDAGTLTFERVWGCAPVPLALSLESQDSFIGSVVYDLNNGNPLGGCEGLPVVIETVDLESITPEVIFRGYITKVSNDTSMGAQNLLRVDCSSMMAYVKQAPFVPAWGSVAVTLADGYDGVFSRREAVALQVAELRTAWEPALWGNLYDPLSPVTGATVSNLWQVREEAKGGIAMRHDFGDGLVGINSEYTISFGHGATVQDNGYRMCFDDGYYMTGAYGPAVAFDVDITSAFEGDRRVDRFSSRLQQQRPTLRGENCLQSSGLATIILDLLLGTYEIDLTFATGARSVNEAAWLPFPSAQLGDLVDLSSLYNLCTGVESPDIPFVQVDGLPLGFLLPYEPASAKTVGDVLETILKRLGAYMVYDKGKFYFGSWNGPRFNPTPVTDADLSDPKISLTFERGLQLQRVDTTFAVDYNGDRVLKFAVPFNNPDLSTIGLGKTMTVGHWEVPYVAPDDASWGQTRMMANAFGLLMRYSQSAARVDLSLRDSAVDLDVGQEVALTTDYIVNSSGGMGVAVLTGYVLKAARSWQTPTTAYTIILPGYLSPQGTVNVWSCSAVVVDVPGGDDIQVDTNVFTAPSVLAAQGAPTSDAETFKLTYELYGNWYDVQLLDQYGTQKYVGGLTGINLGTNMLTLPGFDAYAVPGDIIVLTSAPFFGAGIASLYDVFQADSAGQVNGSTAFARKWVP